MGKRPSLNAQDIPDFRKEDLTYLQVEEDKKYASLKNRLIEFQLGAEEGLSMLHKEVVELK